MSSYYHEYTRILYTWIRTSCTDARTHAPHADAHTTIARTPTQAHNSHVHMHTPRFVIMANKACQYSHYSVTLAAVMQ